MKDGQKTKPPPSSFLHDSAFSEVLDQEEIDELPRVRVIKSALKGSSSVSNAYIINTGSRGGAGVLRGRATPRRQSAEEQPGGLGRGGSGGGSGSGSGEAAAAGADPASAAAAFAPPPPSPTAKSRAQQKAAEKGRKGSPSTPPPRPRSPLPGAIAAAEAGATTTTTTASAVAAKVARRQRAAAMATLRALLDGGAPYSSASLASAAVPTFAVSCRECSRAVAGALRAASVERFEVFSTGGGVAEERALAAALAAVVRGVRIKGRKDSEKLDASATATEEEEEEEEEDLGARLVLSVCHQECSHASKAVSSWVAAGGRHLEPPPPRRGGGRRGRQGGGRRKRGSGSSGSTDGGSDDDEGLFEYENCGLSVIKAIGGALHSIWAFLVDKPPTEEERAKARQKRHERAVAEAARRGEGSTTAVLSGESGSGSGGSRPASPLPAGADGSPCGSCSPSQGIFNTRPLKHDVDGAPVSLETAVDAFAVERAEEEWVCIRKEMAAREAAAASAAAAAAAAASSRHRPSSASSSPRGSIDGSAPAASSSFEPALHEFAPPELSREARATAVKNALRGVKSSGEDADADDASAAAAAAAGSLAVAAAVAEEGARLSAAALLKSLCRAAGGQLASSVVVAALRLEGPVVAEDDGDSEEEEEEGGPGGEKESDAAKSLKRDLGTGGNGGSARNLLSRVLTGSARNLAAKAEAANAAAAATAAAANANAASSSSATEKKKEKKKRQPRPQPPPPLPRSFSVLRKGWCEVDGARRCYYFES